MQSQLNESLTKNMNVIRESSVFSGIQQSVQDKDSSAFSLLLAMVTEDSLELDEFHLPVNKIAKNTSDLEKTFHIVPETLVGDANLQQDLLFSELVHSKNQQDIKLLLSLQPQPLLIKNDEIEKQLNLPSQLVNSLNVNQQAKLYKDVQQNSKQQVVNSADNVEVLNTEVDTAPEMDIESWFSVLEQARTLSKVA